MIFTTSCLSGKVLIAADSREDALELLQEHVEDCDVHTVDDLREHKSDRGVWLDRDPDRCDFESLFTGPSAVGRDTVIHEDLTDEQRQRYISAARDNYVEAGSIEVDDNAKLSSSDEGCYVGGWLWVGKDDL